MATEDQIERPGAEAWVPEGASIEELREAAPDCRGCELWEPATQVVFSAGSTTGRVALVGEQPGDQEDRAGIPFVGPAGKLLQKALDEVGVQRSDLYVTNAVKHFRFTQAGPGKRRIHQTPDRAHVIACRPWLAAELVIVDPQIVVALGATAAKAMLGPDFRVTRERGQLLKRETSIGEKQFVATVHPSAILRATDRDAAYSEFLSDLQVVAKALA